MDRRLLVFCCLLLSACNPSEETRITAVIGAVLLDGTGGPPVSDSVVLVAGSRVRAAGPRAVVPVTAGSDKVDGSGRFVVPAIVEARPARECRTLAEVKAAVDGGAKVIGGMIADTTSLDDAFVARLRNLQVTFVPMLAREAPGSAAARNTRALAAAGVRMAVGGADPLREMEALSAAGMPPADILVAATRNGAVASGQGDLRGTLEPGKRADLLLLRANPAEDVRAWRQLERRMDAGQWAAAP